MDIFAAVIILACLYIAFPRQFRNTVIRIVKRKDFVVVLMKKANSEVIEKWLVVPPPDKLTKIKDGRYNLNPAYKAGNRAGRDYFLCDEKDGIPRLPEKDTKEKIVLDFLLDQFDSHLISTPKIVFGSYDAKDIIFQAHEIQIGLQNRISEIIFAKKKDQTFWILIGLLIVSLFLAWYEVGIIRDMKPLLEKVAGVNYGALDNLTRNTLR